MAGRNESAGEISDWSGEDGEGLATEEEEADTKGGEGGRVSEKRTATTWGTQESSAGELTGGTAASGIKTRKAASASADKAGSGGRHGERSGVRERVVGRRENPARESSGVGGDEGVRKAYGVASEPSGVGGKEGGRKAHIVAENHGGDRQGVRGGVELPQGIDTPGVDEFPRWNKNPGVSAEGEGVTREDGRGRGGTETPAPPEQPRREYPAAATRS